MTFEFSLILGHKLLIPLLSLCLSLVVGFASIKIAWRYHIIDTPGSSNHKKHKSPTPLSGGLTLIATLVLVLIAFRQDFSADVFKIISSSFIVFIFGLVDDKTGKAAGFKLLGQILASLLLIGLGIQVSFLTSLGGQSADLINFFVTVFWLVGITNAFNLVDSMDGLATGLGAISSLLIIVGSILVGQFQLTLLASAIFGTLIGILFYNVSPAKMFLGDSGAQSLGFILASIAILYNPAVPPQASSWFVPLTFLAIPIFDVCLVFFSRIRRSKPIYVSDLNHSYHRLIRIGLPPARAIIAMDIAALVVGMIGLYALFTEPLQANTIFLALLTLGVLVFFKLDQPTYLDNT